MNRVWMSGAAAVMAVSIASAHAQTAGSQDPQKPTPTQTMAATTQATTTVTGCVYKEDSVPGRDPNVVERAGILEDYILVTSDMRATGTTGATPATPPAATPPTAPPTTPPTTPPATAPPTATPATPPAAATGGVLPHKAFKLEHADDQRLQMFVGKMVAVTGTVDADDDTRPAGTAGTAPARDRIPGNPDEIELPEFEVTSIREVQGTCPAKPNLPGRK